MGSTPAPITADTAPLDALTRLDDAVVAGDSAALLSIARSPAAAYHSYLLDEPAREVWAQDPEPMLLALHTSADPYTRAQVARDPACPDPLLHQLMSDADATVARAARDAAKEKAMSRVDDYAARVRAIEDELDCSTSDAQAILDARDLIAARESAARGFDDMARRMRIVDEQG